MTLNLKSTLLWLSAAIAVSANAETPQPPAPNEPDGAIGGHEYVDLGLPSGALWATYNVGASSPYETGQYFAWGEVEPKEDFSWESYKFFEGYEHDPENGHWAVLENIGNDISGTEYDAARHQWGNGWRLPNEQERYELRMLCWHNGISEENGIRGARIYGPNGHSIFLPICGFGLWYGEQDPYKKISGAYWTGVDTPENGFNGRPIEPSNSAKSLSVDLSGFTGATSKKACGLNVRAVFNPNDAGVNTIAYDKNCIVISFLNGEIIISGTDRECRLEMFDLSGRTKFSASVENSRCLLPPCPTGFTSFH